MRGRWYAGGELLVLDYDTAEEAQSVILRILDIAPDVIKLSPDGTEVRLVRAKDIPSQTSNQARELTASRCAAPDSSAFFR